MIYDRQSTDQLHPAPIKHRCRYFEPDLKINKNETYKFKVWQNSETFDLTIFVRKIFWLKLLQKWSKII